MIFDRFSRELVHIAAGTVFVRRAGDGPAVLLLHGFPETGLAWRRSHQVPPGHLLSRGFAMTKRHLSVEWQNRREDFGRLMMPHTTHEPRTTEAIENGETGVVPKTE